MKSEKIREIVKRLEELTEEEVDGFMEKLPANSREKLFVKVVNEIYKISDVQIKNENDVVVGIGTSLSDGESGDICLCYTMDTEQLELMKDLETVLVITKDSSVLENLKEILDEAENV